MNEVPELELDEFITNPLESAPDSKIDKPAAVIPI
jgi:hypothetical protein